MNIGSRLTGAITCLGFAAGGNSTHTARMLKKLNTQTTTLQAMVDDLTIQVRQYSFCKVVVAFLSRHVVCV